jgi:hypothetical protein
LYNVAAGESYATSTSPKDTLWAFGDIADATSLSYQTLESLRTGNLATSILGKAMVVRLINEDIYFSIRFTIWGRNDAGTVAYTRSTPPAGVPIVGIARPFDGAIFADPADIKITVDATVSGGEVTNASVYAETMLLGSVTAAPFIFAASNLVVGKYSLSAVATASGFSATSGVVHITIVSPVDITLGSPTKSDELFSFSYTANSGLRYVVQRASNVNFLNSFNWTSVLTNVASSNQVRFTEELNTNVLHLFRVGRLPNP